MRIGPKGAKGVRSDAHWGPGVSASRRLVRLLRVLEDTQTFSGDREESKGIITEDKLKRITSSLPAVGKEEDLNEILL